MTYEQIVSKVKAKYADADASSLSGTVAIQINLTGKNVEGIFYIEAKDGKVNVEDFPLLMHVDDILTNKAEVNIPWEKFTFVSE